MKIKLIPLFGLFMFLSSCTKDSLLKADSFIFGYAFNMCVGDCATFFLIKNNNIYPDNTTNYNNSVLQFKKNPLPVEKYNLAKKLIDDFPEYLIENPDTTFGCPDCADQGGMHIEVIENGETKTWHLDTEINSIPVEIRSYVQEIKDVIQQL